MLPPERVAAAEYAKRRVLADVTETRFGTFVHDTDHATRAAATQFLDARLPTAETSTPRACDPVCRDQAARALLARVDSLYDGYSLPHRAIAGVDAATAGRLAPLARARGYEREDYWALIPHLVDPPTADHDVDIDARTHGSDAALAVHESVGRDPEGVAYAAAVAGELDGTELVAFRDGSPVGVAGWYVHGGARDDEPVARLTHVGVRPDVQDEGVGAELVRAVVDRCPLAPARVVVCATPERVGFYEELGFVRNNAFWRFARLP